MQDRTPEMATTTSAADAAAALVPANDLPVALHPQVAELHRIRAALYAKETASGMRLAVQSLSGRLVMVAAPLHNAAFLTPARLNASARLLAVLGLVIGTRNLAAAHDVLGPF